MYSVELTCRIWYTTKAFIVKKWKDGGLRSSCLWYNDKSYRMEWVKTNRSRMGEIKNDVKKRWYHKGSRTLSIIEEKYIYPGKNGIDRENKREKIISQPTIL